MTAAKNIAGHRDSDSEQQSMFEGPESTGKKRSAAKHRKGSLHLKGSRSLERLRDRIDLAVKELHRLREENLELQKRLDGLKLHNMDDLDGTQVVFTESPAALRARVESLVTAIDRHLQLGEAATSAENQDDTQD
jgi:hypothetical protein